MNQSTKFIVTSLLALSAIFVFVMVGKGLVNNNEEMYSATLNAPKVVTTTQSEQTDPTEILYKQLDNCKEENRILQNKYDSLFFACKGRLPGVEEPVVVAKPKPSTSKPSKPKTPKTTEVKGQQTPKCPDIDTLFVYKDSIRVLKEQVKDLTEATGQWIEKYIHDTDSLANSPRMGAFSDRNILIESAAYPDTTIYDILLDPRMNVSVAKLKKDFFLNRRVYKVTATSNNDYAADLSKVVSTYKRAKDMRKIDERVKKEKTPKKRK